MVNIMKNVSESEIKKCIFKEFDEFKSVIEEITDGLLTCEYDLDGLCTTETKKAEENETYWEENILNALSEYFGVEVTSFHADDSDYLSVWICYK